MTNLLGSEFFRISIVLFFVSSLLVMLFKNVRKVLTKNKMKTLIYLLCVALVFAASALLTSPKVLNDSISTSFFAIELILFIAGIFHVYASRIHFKELTEKKSNFINEFILAIVVTVVALIAFMNVVAQFKEPFSIIFMSAGFAFIIPVITYKMYEFSALIPVPVYKSWWFPVGKKMKEPTGNELSNPLVISLEFKKNRSDSEISRFKVKAPVDMEFGRLFYFFVDDYNEFNPDSQIQVKQRGGNPDGWIFFFKPNWYSAVRHIDATKTVDWNEIKEESKITVQRVS